MKYKIGEIASLMNLSTESIRHYERMGIIHPKKAESSAYRYYSPWDVMVLGTCRHYRSLGFSLEDISGMMNAKASDGVLPDLQKQEERIQEEIMRQCQLLRAIRAWRKEAESTKSLVGRFELEQSVPTLYLPYQYGDGMQNDAAHMEHLAEWISFVPYVYFALRIPPHSTAEDENTFDVGLGMAEVAVDFLHPKPYDKIKHIPSNLCIHTAAELPLTRLSLITLGKSIDRHLRQKGLQACGDIVCRCNLLMMKQENLHGLFDCLVPVE